jgi:hypothetical protein
MSRPRAQTEVAGTIQKVDRVAAATATNCHRDAKPDELGTGANPRALPGAATLLPAPCPPTATQRGSRGVAAAAATAASVGDNTEQAGGRGDSMAASAGARAVTDDQRLDALFDRAVIPALPNRFLTEHIRHVAEQAGRPS